MELGQPPSEGKGEGVLGWWSSASHLVRLRLRLRLSIRVGVRLMELQPPMPPQPSPPLVAYDAPSLLGVRLVDELLVRVRVI